MKEENKIKKEKEKKLTLSLIYQISQENIEKMNKYLQENGK